MRNARCIRSILFALCFLPCAALAASGAPNQCNQPAPDAVAWIDLPGKLPFQALPTADGCWLFVSLAVGDADADDQNPDAQIAVFRRRGGQISLARTVPVGGNPTGMVLTHDGRALIVADGRRLAVLDVARMTSGASDAVIAYWNDSTPHAGRTYVNVTSDDAYLFSSDEDAGTVTVLNLAKARRSGFTPDAAVGRVTVGNGPVAVTLSPDDRFLYNTTLNMPAGPGWPAECQREWLRDPSPPVPQGAITVIDVARAKSRPQDSVVARVPAGCTPVRLVLSPDGDVAYVSARGANALLAFDTARLVSDSAHALLGRVPTGPNPIGIAVIDAGRRVVVTNSNRFGANAQQSQSLLVIDATKISAGKGAVVGSIPAEGLPREMRLTADGRTLLVVNTSSRKLQVIDVARLLK